MPNTKPIGVAYSDPVLDGAVIGGTTPGAGTFTTAVVGYGGAMVTVGTTGSTLRFKGVTAASNVTAVLTTGAATGLVAFANTAQLQSAVDAINSILTALKNAGIMASS